MICAYKFSTILTNRTNPSGGCQKEWGKSRWLYLKKKEEAARIGVPAVSADGHLTPGLSVSLIEK